MYNKLRIDCAKSKKMINFAKFKGGEIPLNKKSVKLSFSVTSNRQFKLTD